MCSFCRLRLFPFFSRGKYKVSLKFILFSLILLTFHYLPRIGVAFYVATKLKLYEESSTRVLPKGGSKFVYKDDQVYWVFTRIENEDERTIELTWSVIVRNMDGTVLYADSYKRSESDENWSWGGSIPTITNEKEVYVSVIIKSLVIRNF